VRQLLLLRIGQRRYALPAEAVERVERMAALIPLPDAPPGVAGVLNLRGALLPVVDPRPRLGMPTPGADPSQHLVVVAAEGRYLLWVDGVDRIVRPPSVGSGSIALGAGRAVVASMVRLDDETVPVLSPAALDPGPIVAELGAPA
jgi:purine-binding chemotaxis protein CheW